MLALEPQFWRYLLREEVLFALGIFLTAIIVVVVTTWAHLERHRADVDLKRDMVARGMSVDEIERVMAAKSPDLWQRRTRKNARQPDQS